MKFDKNQMFSRKTVENCHSVRNHNKTLGPTYTVRASNERLTDERNMITRERETILIAVIESKSPLHKGYL